MKNTINTIMSNSSIVINIVNRGIQQLAIENRSLVARGLPEKTFFIDDIPFELMDIGSYQREVNQARVNKIVNTFDYSLVSIKSVNFRNGRFFLMDGNHTMNALKRLGYNSMRCKVFVGLSIEEEAHLFAYQDKNVSRVSNYDKFIANVIAKNPSTKEINDIVIGMGLSIAKAITGCKVQARTISSIRTLEKTYSLYGADGVKFMLQLIFDIGWESFNNGFSEHILLIGKEAYVFCKNDNAKYDKLLIALHGYEDPTDFINKIRIQFQQKIVSSHDTGSIKAFVHNSIA